MDKFDALDGTIENDGDECWITMFIPILGSEKSKTYHDKKRKSFNRTQSIQTIDSVRCDFTGTNYEDVLLKNIWITIVIAIFVLFTIDYLQMSQFGHDNGFKIYLILSILIGLIFSFFYKNMNQIKLFLIDRSFQLKFIIIMEYGLGFVVALFFTLAFVFLFFCSCYLTITSVLENRRLIELVVGLGLSIFLFYFPIYFLLKQFYLLITTPKVIELFKKELAYHYYDLDDIELKIRFFIDSFLLILIIGAFSSILLT